MSDISKINPNGTEYNLKDATARAGIESSKTLKSSIVTVNDAAPINAEDITVDITPQQDLHGYGRPWAGGGWKNKLPLTLANIKAANTAGTWNGNAYTLNGITFTVETDDDDNVTCIKANGTSTADWVFLNIPTFTLTAGNYILNGCTNGKLETYRIDILPSGAASLNGDTAFSVSENSQFSVRCIIRQSGYTANNVTFYPMIRLATETDATFAPYSNICPIEGWTGAELDRVGKNWCKSATPTAEIGAYYPALYCEMTLRPSTTYTFSFRGTLNNWLYPNESLFTSYGSFVVTNEITVVTVTTKDTILASQYSESYGWLIFKNATSQANINIFSDVMVELGSTHTAYEPYQGQQYTASFGETVYGGKWHVTKGGTDKTMAEVDLGDLSWTYFAGTGHRYFTANLSPLPKRATSGNSKANLLCSRYKNDTGNNVYNNVTDGIIAIPADNDIVMVFDSRYTDATAFKTAVTGVQLAYELATPTAISTPKQNVPMLKGINTVSADCGDTSLEYQPDNVIGELKGEIEDNIIYEDFKWTTESSQSYSAGTPGTYGTSCWRDVKKEGYDVIGVTFVENRRFGDCILTLYYIPSTSHVEVIIFRATSSAVTIADEDIEYRVAYKKRT
jgi:hypothetical protein